jgi:S-adenosylmethionine/arginine decarboxylase-like enzyme
LSFVQLNDAVLLEAVVLRALANSGVSSEQVIKHRFVPQGLSIAFFGAECRVLLHTWPELSTVTLDVHAVSECESNCASACIEGLRALHEARDEQLA